MATVVSLRMASLADLSTVLGLEDLHDLLEIITVDAHNRRLIEAERDK